jgi:predicted dehydrogenase
VGPVFRSKFHKNKERFIMRVAFIGVGHWHADMHADAARRAGAFPAAGWDPDPERTQAFCAKFGCVAASTLKEAIAQADLVVVMGRPVEIAERGLAVIEAGVPVLLEKPIGVSAGAADPLIAAVQSRNAFAAVALPHGPGMMAALKDLDAAGRLGPLSHSHFRLINGPPQRYVDDGVSWVLDREIGGGGALRNLGIHGVNAFLTLAGEQQVRVISASFGKPVHGTEVEDYATAMLRAADGTLGLIEAGYTFASMRRGIFEWRVSSRNATLTDLGERLSLSTLDNEGQRDLTATPIANRYDDMMADTLKRLADGSQPAVSIAQCRRAMAIIDRCYEIQGA